MKAQAPATYSSAELLRSLGHDVRGHLARLHLRLSLFKLPQATLQEALDELANIDICVRSHLDLVREAPQREPTALPIRDLAQQLLAELPDGDRVVLDPSLKLELRSWPELLQGVLRAIVCNALTHGKPPVSLHAEQCVDSWRLSVVDHGNGFVRPRADEQSARSPLASGVGLLAADHLARLLGGTIEARCEVGICTVSLHCPNQPKPV